MTDTKEIWIRRLAYASIGTLLMLMAGLWFTVPMLQSIAEQRHMDLPFATRLMFGLGVWERRYGAIVLGLWMLAAYAAMRWRSLPLTIALLVFAILCILGACASLIPPFAPYL